MSFPVYPKYRDSGVASLGEVPEHWAVLNVRRLAVSVQTGGTPSSEPPAADVDQGLVWYTPGDFGDSLRLTTSARKISSNAVALGEAKLFPPRSVLVVSIGATLGRVGFAEDASSANQQINAVIPNERIDAYFLAYSLSVKTDVMRFLSNASTIGIMNQEKAKEIVIAVPPPTEQTVIGAFLDRETAKIDALVAEQRRLIDLLKEKRQAVISHAVTKGLNSNVPMKPSGIEWLGDVPAHWEVKRLKQLIDRIESGTSVNASDEPAEEGALGVLKTSCVYTGTFDPSENKTVVVEDFHRVSCPLTVGTLIVSRMNTPELIGAAGAVTAAPDNLYLPDRLWQVYFSNANVAFIHYWTLSNLYRAQVEAACTGTSSSMKNLGQDEFGGFVLVAPPLVEQAAVVAFLDSEMAQFSTLAAEAERAIYLLQERRTALISAAVAGKIDVRGLVETEAA